MTDDMQLIERTLNTIRFLSVDAIQKANSGHPGLPMGAAAAAYTLWTRHYRHAPGNPAWCNRDRFVLSAGHGSMLLYVLLHLTGYDLSLDDLKQFRQWGSRTPGHPEYGVTPGVEMTTGPLGQGISSAVGIAIAEAYLAARFNKDEYPVVDHHTYVLAGDGDMMEGVTAEACSLAGHLGLGKLIVLYDDNGISLAGSAGLSMSEDMKARFEACGWQVLTVDDGNNVDAIDTALTAAWEEKGKPSLLRIRTVIGFGAPSKANTFGAHGAPLGQEEVAAAKKKAGWPEDEAFFIPEDVRDHMRETLSKGKEWETAWDNMFSRYRTAYPDDAAEFERIIRGDLPASWKEVLPVYDADHKGISTRKVSEAVLQQLAPVLGELIGGTADLNPSTLAWLKGCGDFQDPARRAADIQGAVGGEWCHAGRNIHFGVREHAMAAIANGMALHGGTRPFIGTFFTFSDYMRPSMRLAALMGLPVIYVFSHDSIGVGEDGPTHQPIEQLMSLRMMPNLTVIRPADANEAVAAWRIALTCKKDPVALVFTRQNVPVIDRRVCGAVDGVEKGGYVLWEAKPGVEPDVILIGTGSETALAMEAGRRMAEEGTTVRVVSLPSWELFDAQPETYRHAVLPPVVRVRVAVEAGMTVGWEHYVGRDGAVVGMNRFGASAPANELFEKFGITVEAVMAAANDVRGRC